MRKKGGWNDGSWECSGEGRGYLRGKVEGNEGGIDRASD